MMRKKIQWAGFLSVMVFLIACGQSEAGTEAVPVVESIPAGGGDETAVYTIIPGESTVRFELEEDLRSALTGWALGARITVVGTSDQVTGQFTLDPNDPPTAQFEAIRIAADTFKTNEFMRNVAIRNQILHTDTYPFIIFQPTEVVGLPSPVTPGESVSFEIIGDLTIQETTRPETFAVTATLLSDGHITGTAHTVIERESYGLDIPSVANVTFVEEEVVLTIDFVARTGAGGG